MSLSSLDIVRQHRHSSSSIKRWDIVILMKALCLCFQCVIADESTLMEYIYWVYHESVNQDKCVQSAFLAMGLSAWGFCVVVIFVEVSMSINLYRVRLKLLISYQSCRNVNFIVKLCKLRQKIIYFMHTITQCPLTSTHV